MDEMPPTSTSAAPSNMNSWRAAGAPVQPEGPLASASTAVHRMAMSVLIK